ncbi:hypothetical protein SLUN_36545 [Streptomyces lunaelactis]|uniref:Uncharacterized protein n=1 Tax=Streptomyces lunaelactis TaxID=1535768 RepID=A0A2R4TCQ2_9ACTN|nr:DUF6158 family protein [Streptomyces lunaelactis]AVZ76877.1 hypothetical protein SLUN_36545 [Streptomyces lunaelactis]NUK00966.1 hypothetical protein [Streptomyces lunaelactis]NUK13210.1 hypothetical protein [Streptomyces lunaelactis]NUK13742.1 hypothetical protein [Streptomyces lunaelactis]NUK21617.1 hypothetical protein [Streptomyces lunaelactis]
MSDAGAGHRGVEPADLDDQQLMRELETIHRTRHDTLLHGSQNALVAHSIRMTELEAEYLKRHANRPVASGRTRHGARARTD